MKKILLLLIISIFLNSCCEGTETFGYYMSSNSTGDHSMISYYTDHKLPESSIQDFLGTIVLFLTEPMIDYATSVYVFYGEDNKEFSANFYNNEQVSVEKNSNFNDNITDLKDINYYTTIITANSRWAGIERAIQLYFRQDRDPTVISFMIRIKPHNATGYEYFGHTVLDKMAVFI